MLHDPTSGLRLSVSGILYRDTPSGPQYRHIDGFWVPCDPALLTWRDIVRVSAPYTPTAALAAALRREER